MISSQPLFWEAYGLQRRLFSLEGFSILADIYQDRVNLFEQLEADEQDYGYITEDTCLQIYETHPKRKIYRIVVGAFVRGELFDVVTLQGSEANRMVFVFDGMMYKCSESRDEIIREVLAWVNFPDSMLTPIDSYDMFSLDGRIYFYLVMPYIPDPISEVKLIDKIEEMIDYEYATHEDDWYEPAENETGAPYIILQNGLRVGDAHVENFRTLHGHLFMVDYNEVDL